MSFKHLRISAMTLVVALATASCDAPVDPLAMHATGVVFLRTDGSEAARYTDRDRVSGRLQVAANQTVTYRVRVLDQDGAAVPPDGQTYSIRNPLVVIALAANVTLRNNDEVVLVGSPLAKPTNTSLRFQLWHSGHFEFEVRDVPLSLQ